jgi:ABC-type multidrug transport system fused ATPase/permease subunit
MCWPDRYFISLAFVFLLLAEIVQVYIPRFLGNILDDLSKHFSNRDADDPYCNKSMWEMPYFMQHV